MERVSSGVNGFDELVEGGFVKGRFHLVAGEAGTGKSTFAMQFALKGIEEGEKSVYVSLEEPIQNMQDNLGKYGLDVQKAADEEKLLYIYTKPFQIKEMVDSSVNQIADDINAFKPGRIVFDSITTFNLEYSGEGVLRGGMNKLMEIVSRWNPDEDVTFLFTAESMDRKARFGIEYVMDSVVKLYNVKQGDGRVRALEVYKMRGTKHSKNLHSLTMEQGSGVVVQEQSGLINADDMVF
jgi:KaiC/GvpD/RAD55 family RecA-like ATPase